MTADIMNRWQETSAKVEAMGIYQSSPGWSSPKLMKVQSSSVLSPNRWGYSLVEITIDDIADPTTWTEEFTETDGDVAINLIESPNTATVAMGITLSEIPAGFSLQPIAVGTVIWAQFNIEPGANEFLCVFSATNQFHGTC
jgi:hypothetical protein